MVLPNDLGFKNVYNDIKAYLKVLPNSNSIEEQAIKKANNNSEQYLDYINNSGEKDFLKYLLDHKEDLKGIPFDRKDVKFVIRVKLGILRPDKKVGRKSFYNNRNKLTQASPDLIKKNFKERAVNEVWCMDTMQTNKDMHKQLGLKAYTCIIVDASGVGKSGSYLLHIKTSSHQTGQVALETLKEAIIKNQAIPKILHTDQGLQFLDKELKDFCKELGIKVSNSPPGSLTHNGLCERGVGMFKESVERLLNRAKNIGRILNPLNCIDFLYNSYCSSYEALSRYGRRLLSINNNYAYIADNLVGKLSSIS